VRVETCVFMEKQCIDGCNYYMYNHKISWLLHLL